MISVVGNPAILHFKINSGEKLSVRTSISDDSYAFRVLHEAWYRHAVMGVPPQYHVDSGNS